MMKTDKACPVCATRLAADATKCFSCGAVLVKGTDVEIDPSQLLKNRHADLRARKLIAAVLVTIFFVIDGFVLWLMWGFSGSDEPGRWALGPTVGCWLVVPSASRNRHGSGRR
jgi:hypothetical protein